MSAGAKMDWVWLKQFCGSKEEKRVVIAEPIRIGEYFHATNGWICVRMKDVQPPEDFEKEPWPRLTENGIQTIIDAFYEPDEWRGILALPDLKARLDCEHCGGSGIFECHSCGHEDECKTCDGGGKWQPETYLETEGVRFLLSNLIRVGKLPGFQLGLRRDQPLKAQMFRFNGGDGVIMPAKFKEELEYVRFHLIPPKVLA